MDLAYLLGCDTRVPNFNITGKGKRKAVDIKMSGNLTLILSDYEIYIGKGKDEAVDSRGKS
jgi:hypothetical protein